MSKEHEDASSPLNDASNAVILALETSFAGKLYLLLDRGAVSFDKNPAGISKLNIRNNQNSPQAYSVHDIRNFADRLELTDDDKQELLRQHFEQFGFGKENTIKYKLRSLFRYLDYKITNVREPDLDLSRIMDIEPYIVKRWVNDDRVEIPEQDLITLLDVITVVQPPEVMDLCQPVIDDIIKLQGITESWETRLLNEREKTYNAQLTDRTQFSPLLTMVRSARLTSNIAEAFGVTPAAISRSLSLHNEDFFTPYKLVVAAKILGWDLEKSDNGFELALEEARGRVGLYRAHNIGEFLSASAKACGLNDTLLAQAMGITEVSAAVTMSNFRSGKKISKERFELAANALSRLNDQIKQRCGVEILKAEDFELMEELFKNQPPPRDSGKVTKRSPDSFRKANNSIGKLLERVTITELVLAR